MNVIKLISAAAIAAVAAASCSRSDEPVTGSDRVEVRFSASAAEIRTRVAETVWDASDPVGIYMIKADPGTLAPGNIVEDAGNRQYTAAAGTGPVSFTPADAAATIYYPMSGNVEFIAYYPYASSLTDYQLPVDVSDQTGQSAIDVLYAPKTNGAYSKSKKDVDLQFTHRLVKLAFNIEAGDGVREPLDGLTVNITSQQTAATLNLTDGTVTATGAASAITANTAANGSSSEAIVLPAGSVSGMTFTFTTAGGSGGTYEVAVPDGSWAAGKKYTYTVTLKRNEAGISGTVSDWGNGGSNIPVTATPEVQIVLIPGGTFLMGSSSSEPNRETNETQHTVTLTRDYYMSKYPITNAQYAEFLNDVGVDNTGRKAGIQSNEQLISASSGSFDWGLHHTGSQWEPVAGYEKHPVIYVSWYGAKAYAEWAGGDLPTEAQWERAARGGVENMPFGIGAGTELTGEMANFNGRSPYDNGTYSDPSGVYLAHTTAAGSYPANAYGLYDMHGNVMEWCLDLWDGGSYAGSPDTDPVGTTGLGRVFRGGYWNQSARGCRSAYRGYNSPGTRSNFIGFRVVFYP